MTTTLRIAQARRIAIAAQGLAAPRPDAVTMRQVQQVINQLGQFQIDSINVVARAHQFPLYSRLGAYDPALLERAAHRAPRRLFEYWGHAASLIDVTLAPALRFRMERAADEAWGGIRRMQAEQPGLVERVYTDIAAAPRPITARQLEHDEVRRRDHWGWNWSEVKTACEWLFWCGRITAAHRNSQFERAFALPEKVLPAAVVAAPTPSVADSHLFLVRRAATALGVASLGCLADYFRLSVAETRQAVSTLVEWGELQPVTVAGWGPAYLWHGARRPRTVAARALLSPFDSMVFERKRLAGLFGFDYRIEIYVPEPKRRFGYYVYPFLLGEEFVARVDLKADRAAGELVVQSAWLEAGHDGTRVARELAAELAELAGWLGLGAIRAVPRGDLADELRRHL
ncbi:cytoplasmic protein [Enemella dayhoffiae]|uniref:Cytoplasmic protein n=1 Tax=Enemella dayhoffiae TaxID=2016507 RepID=A0A255GUP5_9ACTN|nr:crosslink repair DNA glycosylase YcaQ family protein [Enemella dayhoffiae]OYO19417.1 cytoplasmic protein [Enemella dayhoffiae]